MAVINIHLGDSLEAMKSMEENKYQLAIVDPPYRDPSENQATKDMRKNGGMGKIGYKYTNSEYENLKRISKDQIIFGANNFNFLPCYKGFIVWKKKTISDDFTMSMAELAYISDGLGTISKVFEYAPQRNKNDNNNHPNQKPVALYKWILKNYAKEGDKIFDSHGGSMSIAIACIESGFDLDIWELDPEYFDAAVKRIQTHVKQLNAFIPQPEINIFK